MRTYLVFLIWTNVLSLIFCNAQNGEVTLDIVSYVNADNLKWDGTCCGNCDTPCDYTFKACINYGERKSCTRPESSRVLRIPITGPLKYPFEIHIEVRTNGELVDAFSIGTTRPKELLLRNTAMGRRPEYPSRLDIDVSVLCHDHFYGDTCSVKCIPADDCTGHYTCDKNTGKKICRKGWTGATCMGLVDKQRNGCPEHFVCGNEEICMFNASAISEIDMYVCCPQKIVSGKNDRLLSDTEDKIKYPCPSNKCRNFGTCNNVTKKCECKQGFAGELCQTDITEIYIQRPNSCPPCTYNNTCYKKPQTNKPSENPSCKENMYGSKCDKKCVPKNTCVDGHYTCNRITGEKLCLSGWGGAHCTIRNTTKECDSECPKMKCKNDGVCFNGSCCCKEGLFTGKYCETEILKCEENPCQNNGQCSNVQNDYRCDCMNGYSGRNCEFGLSTTSSTIKTTSTSATKPSTASSSDTTTSATTKLSTTHTSSSTTKTSQLPITTTIIPTTIPTTTLKAEKPTTSVTTFIPTVETTVTPTPETPIDIYIVGKVKDKDKGKLEHLLNESMANIVNDKCNPEVKIVDIGHLISGNGVDVTKVSIDVNDCVNVTDPTKNSNFTTTLNHLLSTTKPFNNGRVLETGHNLSELKDLSYSYDVDLIGYVYSSNLRIIKDKLLSAWSMSYRDIPEVDVLVILREFYIGDHGIRVRKLAYFVTSKGKLLRPTTTPPPSLSVLKQVFDGADQEVNDLYTGQTALLYDDGVRLNLQGKPVDISTLRNSLEHAWRDHMKNKRSLNTTVDIRVSRSEPCSYFQRTDVYSVIYITVIRGQANIDPPVLSNVEFSLCKCQPKRLFYVDIQGRVKMREQTQVQNKVLSAWVTSRAGEAGSLVDKVTLHQSDSTPVTRLWFRQAEKSHDNLNEWPNPNMGDKLEDIESNLAVIDKEINRLKTEKWYRLVLAGIIVNNRRHQIEAILLNAWRAANTDIPKENIKISITKWSSNYSCAIGETLTSIQYKVKILKADSSETSVVEPNNLQTTMSTNGMQYLGCTPRRHRDLHIVGHIAKDNKTDLQTVIQKVWTTVNQGLPVNITAHITMLKVIQTSSGHKTTKVQYYVDPVSHGKDVDEEDIDEPEDPKLQKGIQDHFPGISILSLPQTETITIEKVDDDNEHIWIYPVIVLACVLVLVAVVAALFAFVRNQRHKDSKTLTQDPEEVEEYDKEHFSEEPEMENNSSLSIEETVWDDQQKQKTYYVN